MRSVLTYNWPTHIDLDILTKVRREMVVIEVGGMVCVMVPRSKTANAWLDEQALSAEAPVIGKETVVENPTLPDLYALALLLHKKILVNPFRLVGAKREDLEDVLSRKYDIAVKENNDHTVTLF